MMQGWPALVVLWVTVAFAWPGVWLVAQTPWRDSAVGQFLFGLVNTWAVWWSLILLGSYANAYWRWLQVVELVAFGGVAVVTVWLVVLMARARYTTVWPRHGRRRRPLPVNPPPDGPRAARKDENA